VSRPLDPETRVARANGLLAEQVAGALVVLRLETGQAVQLNATGAWLWDRLESSQTVASLVQGMADRYGIDSERARRDVDSFVADLDRRQMLLLEDSD
jgi:Coenzyme PQQ synthesis protein D (PqqD)